MEDWWRRARMRSPLCNGLTVSRADRGAPIGGPRPGDSGLGKWAGCGRRVARGPRPWVRSDQKPRSPLAVARGRKPRKGGYQNQPRDCETGGPNPSKRTSPFSDIRMVLRRGRIRRLKSQTPNPSRQTDLRKLYGTALAWVRATDSDRRLAGSMARQNGGHSRRLRTPPLIF